jgi:hypothetical protein
MAGDFGMPCFRLPDGEFDIGFGYLAMEQSAVGSAKISKGRFAQLVVAEIILIWGFFADDPA